MEFFIDRYNRKFRKSVQGITDDTRKLMMKYDWPGNVRELKNAVERAMILEDSDVLRPEYLPFAVAQQQAAYTAFEMSSGSSSDNGGSAKPNLPDGRSLPKLTIPEGGTSLEEVERALVEMAMAQASGNQTHAARLLDISRDALRYKLKKFGLIHAEEDEPTPLLVASNPLFNCNLRVRFSSEQRCSGCRYDASGNRESLTPAADCP